MKERFMSRDQHLQDVALRRRAVERVLYRYGRRYPQINLDSIVYSADLEHTAFITRDKQRVVVDGREYAGGDDVINLKLSPDGARSAFTVFHRDEDGFSLGRWHVVVDGEPGPPLDAYYPLAHVPGGHKSMFEPLWPKGGQPFPPCAIFSPSSTSVGYHGPAMKDPAWQVVVVNGEVGPKFSDILGLCFSADGAHHAYQVHVNGKACVCVDGSLGPPFDHIASLQLLPDGTPAYRATHSSPRREELIRGEEVLVSGHSISEFWLNDQGQLSGCLVATERDRWRMHAPRGESKAYACIDDCVWTADHSQYALVGVDQMNSESVDESFDRSALWQEEPWGEVSVAPVIVSSARRPWHWATRRDILTAFPKMDDRPATVMGARYWAEGERPWHVYSDGRELTSADGIGEGSLQFSADGQRLGWVEVVDGEGFIVIDGRRYGPYQDIEPGSMQVSDSGATFIALCGDEWKKIAVP